MKRIILLLLVISGVQLSFAQSLKIDIGRELSKIYSEFDQRESELDKKYLDQFSSKEKQNFKGDLKVWDSLYKVNYRAYYNELKPFQAKKTENLKSLLQLLNDANPLIGKTVYYFKDVPGEEEKIAEAKKNPENSRFVYMGILKSDQKDLIEDQDKIQTIRKDFVNNLDSSYFSESGEDTLSAQISFVLDDDGYFKRIKPLKGNEEFAYFCAINLYQMKKRYEPNTYKGKPVLTRFVLPIKMKFE